MAGQFAFMALDEPLRDADENERRSAKRQRIDRKGTTTAETKAVVVASGAVPTGRMAARDKVLNYSETLGLILEFLTVVERARESAVARPWNVQGHRRFGDMTRQIEAVFTPELEALPRNRIGMIEDKRAYVAWQATIRRLAPQLIADGDVNALIDALDRMHTVLEGNQTSRQVTDFRRRLLRTLLLDENLFLKHSKTDAETRETFIAAVLFRGIVVASSHPPPMDEDGFAVSSYHPSTDDDDVMVVAWQRLLTSQTIDPHAALRILDKIDATVLRLAKDNNVYDLSSLLAAASLPHVHEAEQKRNVVSRFMQRLKERRVHDSLKDDENPWMPMSACQVMSTPDAPAVDPRRLALYLHAGDERNGRMRNLAALCFDWNAAITDTDPVRRLPVDDPARTQGADAIRLEQIEREMRRWTFYLYFDEDQARFVLSAADVRYIVEHNLLDPAVVEVGVCIGPHAGEAHEVNQLMLRDVLLERQQAILAKNPQAVEWTRVADAINDDERRHKEQEERKQLVAAAREQQRRSWSATASRLLRRLW